MPSLLEQVARWVKHYCYPRTEYRQTSAGSRHKGLPVLLSDNGKLSNTLLNTGTGNGLDADTVDGSHASAFATSGHTHSGAVDVTGTPVASNLASWSDANTIQDSGYDVGDFAAAVHTHSGAVDVTGTPVASNLASWADANTVQDSGYDVSDFATAAHSHAGMVDVTGTPVANNFTSWSDANTVKDSGYDATDFATAAHSHAGMVDVTGTPVASNLASWADANTVQDSGYDVSDFATAAHTHSGMVDVTGTPTAGRLASWSDANTVQDAGFLASNVLKADGTVALTADWDAGASRAIKVQEIQARSNLGLRIEDDGGVLGIFVEDSTGDLGFGTDTPGVKVDVISSASNTTTMRLTPAGDTSTSSATYIARTNGGDVELVFSAHDTLRTETRFGQTIGGFAELLMRGTGITGALIGLGTNDPLILGTNDAERMRITGTGDVDVQAGAATGSDARVGGILYASATTVGNVGAGEDNLISFTIPADTLDTDGQSIWFEAVFRFTNSANAKTAKVYFGSTTLITLGSGGGTAIDTVMKGRIFRTGATTQKADAAYVTSIGSAAYAFYTTPAETLSSTVVIKGTGQATSNDEVTMTSLIVGWSPVNS